MFIIFFFLRIITQDLCSKCFYSRVFLNFLGKVHFRRSTYLIYIYAHKGTGEKMDRQLMEKGKLDNNKDKRLREREREM